MVVLTPSVPEIEVFEIVLKRPDVHHAVLRCIGKVKHVHFVAETKGFMSSMDLRKIEESKIDCPRKFFAKITSEQVKYDVVDGYGKQMELMA